MPPSIQKKVAQIIAPAKLFVMYGASEAAPRLSYLDPDDLYSKCGSVGKAIANVELFVVDEDGNRLPANSAGEIVARGSNIRDIVKCCGWIFSGSRAEPLRGLF